MADKIYATIDDAIAAAGLADAVAADPSLRDRYIREADERYDLEESANRILPERSDRWGDTSDRDVRTAVLSYLSPGVRFDDKSDAYVQGRFEHEVSKHTGHTMTTRHDAGATGPAESMQARMYRLTTELSDARMQASVTVSTSQRAELEARANQILAELMQLRAAADRSVPQLAPWQMPLDTSTSTVTERQAQSQLPGWRRPTSKSKRSAVETLERLRTSAPDWTRPLSTNRSGFNDDDA
jgi:hypothetical protein